MAFDQFNRVCALHDASDAQIKSCIHDAVMLHHKFTTNTEANRIICNEFKSIKLTSKLKNQSGSVDRMPDLCEHVGSRRTIDGSCISVSCKNDSKHAETADSQMSFVLQWTRCSGSSDKYPVPVQPYYAWQTDAKPNFTVYWVVGVHNAMDPK